MGKKSRDKGYRVERSLKIALNDAGIPTRRVIGSGAYGAIDSRLAGDLQIGVYGHPERGGWLLTGEAKGRKQFSTKQLDDWLADNDLLLLKPDRKEVMAYLPWRTLVPLLEAFYHSEVPASQRLTEVEDGDNIDSGSDLPGDEHLHGG